MAELVYALCGVTSIFCAVLLVRGYVRTKRRLLLWSSLGFVGFALNNVLLFLDLVVVASVDLSLVRAASAFVAAMVLLGGLLWERP